MYKLILKYSREASQKELHISLTKPSHFLHTNEVDETLAKDYSMRVFLILSIFSMKLSLIKTGLGALSVMLVSVTFSGNFAYAATEDVRLKTLENSGSVTPPDFKVQHFNSCQDAKSTIADFLESYYKKHPYTPPYIYGGGGRGGIMLDKGVVSPATVGAAE